ncbi:hypothetical protein MGG_04944 [Pyricularia oryzae 70-15]|uniref:Malate dehydrogenase n=1 Tax=Pyricularia oryzae (strain 70-15 / ATCC MYA-4617 / FGSC 8958) TaxID=242507 RepID=G4N375_PYRO7|nr:uncharacterized protein MGG_04944 [Pyricularia oryzae 70-15]EHA52631.1 hypothetical protein MGG_04944 [Pyricularia oryzae 70-15]KAI7930411.1 hypothetical protein M9X92_000848 [Pyricularia oryzae]
MFSKTLLFAAALVASVSASPCKPRASGIPLPVLPSTGAVDLPAPNPSCALKAIAVGHGIQNYTCADGNATPVAAGALAVLYDVTSLYPGTPSTGLSKEAFNALTTSTLWGSNIPLNLKDPEAARPGTPASPNNGMPPSSYGAVVADPFIAPADLPQPDGAPLKFLGHHFFDAAGNPTFDLSTMNLRFSVGLKQSVDVPANADRGILDTGAVKWLMLNDNGKGLGNTGATSQVYRVITAGGVGEACSKEGAVPVASVPYTAFYWFYAE